MELTPEQLAADEKTSPEELTKLAQQSRELAIIVTQNVAAPANLLEELSKNSDVSIRKAVCANPNTPLDVLWKLASEFPRQLLENPILDCLLLENPDFLDDMPIDVLIQLLKQTKCPEYVQQLASNSKQGEVRCAVAEHPNVSTDILEKLATDRDVFVRCAVAEHPNVSLDILEKLATDHYLNDVRRVLRQKDCLEYFQQLSSSSKQWKVLYAVAGNPNTSIGTLEKLAAGCENNRCAVAGNPNASVDILEKLAADHNKYVRCAVARNPNVSVDILEKLAADHPIGIRFTVAENPNTSISILKKLAADHNERVRLAATKNLNVNKKLKRLMLLTTMNVFILLRLKILMLVKS